VLTKADIERRQQEVIDAVTSVLGISGEDAGRILRKYKWWGTWRTEQQDQFQRCYVSEFVVNLCRDANRVNEEWFTDMDKVRAAVGMVDEAPEPPGSTDKVRESKPISRHCGKSSYHMHTDMGQGLIVHASAVHGGF